MQFIVTLELEIDRKDGIVENIGELVGRTVIGERRDIGIERRRDQSNKEWKWVNERWKDGVAIAIVGNQIIYGWFIDQIVVDGRWEEDVWLEDSWFRKAVDRK